MKIILHHSAVSPKVQKYQFLPINNYHKDRWNFRSTLGFYGGYQYLIEANGSLYQYRRDTEEGAHTLGNNKDSIGICLAGDFNNEMPTEKQITRLKKLLKEKFTQYKISVGDIYLHRNLQNYRTCPGKLISDDWPRRLLQLEMPSTEDEEKKELLTKKMTLLNKILSLLLVLKKRWSKLLI